MNRITVLAMGIFALLSVSLFAQPKLDIDGGFTYDWGKVKPSDSPLKAKIKILNRGTDTLIIKDFKPGCGCTSAPLEKKNIEPGGFSAVEVTLNVGSNTGDLTKSITITSNDPEKSSATMYLKANIFVPVNLFPRWLSFNKLYVAEETLSKVVITSNIDKPIKFVKVTSEPAEMSINIKDGMVLNPKETISLEAKITPAAPGRLAAKVTILTDNQEMPTLEITGWGNIVTKEEGQAPTPATPVKTN